MTSPIPGPLTAPSVGGKSFSGWNSTERGDLVNHAARVRRLEERVPPWVERCPDCVGLVDPRGVKIFLPDNGRRVRWDGPEPCARCSRIVIYTPDSKPQKSTVLWGRFGTPDAALGSPQTNDLGAG